MINSITDVMIHTRKLLSDEEFADLSSQLYAEDGVVSLSRNMHTPRCLMVVYNATKTGAERVLHTVIGKGYQASLVGL